MPRNRVATVGTRSREHRRPSPSFGYGIFASFSNLLVYSILIFICLHPLERGRNLKQSTESRILQNISATFLLPSVLGVGQRQGTCEAPRRRFVTPFSGSPQFSQGFKKKFAFVIGPGNEFAQCGYPPDEVLHLFLGPRC